MEEMTNHERRKEQTIDHGVYDQACASRQQTDRVLEAIDKIKTPSAHDVCPSNNKPARHIVGIEEKRGVINDVNFHALPTKRGFIRKLLHRSTTHNTDLKHHPKVVEFRAHQFTQALPLTTKTMGNVQAGEWNPTTPVKMPHSPSSHSAVTHNHSYHKNSEHSTGSDASVSQRSHHRIHVLNGGSAIVSDECSDVPHKSSPLPHSVEQLQAMVQQRDNRIQYLERELDKVRSVLDQKLESWTESSHSTNLGPVTSIQLSPISDTEKKPSLTTPTTPPLTTNQSPPAAAYLLKKRIGVSGEPIRIVKDLTYHEKDAKSRQQIRTALRNNEFLTNLDAVQLQEIVSCMHEQTVPAGCYIIREGEDAEHLYVGAVGEYEVTKNGKRLTIMGAGRCFGEVALLYNCKRTASIKALKSSRLWVVDRASFQAIMMKTGLERIEERKAFLGSVPLLKDVPVHRIARIADALEAQYHAPGDCIIRQGELADSFFIIQSGKVNVTITVTGDNGLVAERNIRQMSKGEFFGEKALLGEGRRTANVYALEPDGVDVLCLYRKDFIELIGNIQALKSQSYVEHETTLTPPKKHVHTVGEIPIDHVDRFCDVQGPEESSKISSSSTRLISLDPDGALQPKPLRTDIHLSQLEHICVLGVGGFGRVDLVTLRHDPTQAFAMKRMQKQHIIQTKQQEHVHLEKLILSACVCPFICHLYATYRDNKYIYMLLEACLGGELWTILRDSHNLDDRTTRFCLACGIEALDYLHRNGIIYRDLKPENMLVTSTGYIKMCDFGFAKNIGIGNKTWTFCGTPEYVAPEVILNKGHDFAADYWSLGILTYELLTGTPPFQASEPIKIYMKTLKGIDALGLAQNKYICLRALQFIRRLCRFNPAERMGVGKHGVQEIRNHKYFQGFDWAAIHKRTLPSPFKVKLNGPLDYSNFDRFTMDEQEPPDELSGWDANF